MPKMFTPSQRPIISSGLSVLSPNKAHFEGEFVSSSFSSQLGLLLLCMTPDKNLCKGGRIYCAYGSRGYSASWEGNHGSDWELQWWEMGGFLLMFLWVRGGRLDKL